MEFLIGSALIGYLWMSKSKSPEVVDPVKSQKEEKERIKEERRKAKEQLMRAQHQKLVEMETQLKELRMYPKSLVKSDSEIATNADSSTSTDTESLLDVTIASESSEIIKTAPDVVEEKA